MKKKTSSPWKAVAVIGAVAGTIGIIAYAQTASAKNGAKTPPLLTPLTSPSVVRIVQTSAANSIKNDKKGLLKPAGLSSANYNINDVDGNPNNPRWVSALSIMQTIFNKKVQDATPEQKAKMARFFPADFPAPLRADGVLDDATLLMLKEMDF